MSTSKNRQVPSVWSVLAVTDLSSSGNEAIPYAFSVLPVGGTVYLLHVMEEPPLPNPMYAHYTRDKFLTPEEKKEKMEKISQSLHELIPEWAENKNITTKIEVIETEQRDEVASIVIEAAEKYGVDAICLTLHDHSLLGSVLSGSVGQAIINKSRLPLFIVRAKK
jgi:nucleotide-binding universal stress UspA family protein